MTTLPLTPETLARLRQLAEKATQGPWFSASGNIWVEGVEEHVSPECCGNLTDSGECRSHCAVPRYDIQSTQNQIAGASADDAEYIAACSPDVILSLLDELSRLKGANKELEAQNAVLVEAALAVDITRHETFPPTSAKGSDMTPETIVEFYCGAPLVTSIRTYAVPRAGEFVNIRKVTYQITRVTWAVDSDGLGGQILRACVEMGKMEP